MPIWYCDKLVKAIRRLSIGIIRDVANVASQRCVPQTEVPLVGAYLVVDVVQLQGRTLPLHPTLAMTQPP